MPRLTPIDEAARAEIAQHDSVVSRRQLASLGIDRDRIARQVRAQRWQVIGGNVVVAHNGPLAPIQHARAAVINAGPHAALGGISALNHWGLRNWSRPQVHVVTTKSRNIEPLDGVVVHESRTLRAEHVVEWSGLRVCRADRAAIDGAGWEPVLRSAIGLLAACVQQQITSASELRGSLTSAGRIRHHRALFSALQDIEGGADALSEIDLGRVCRQAGLPAPTRQAKRRGADGRVRYLDAEYRLRDGTVLGIEVDGAHHLSPEAWWSDQQRSNALAATGTRILRFPAWVVRERPEQVARELRAALTSLGGLAA